MLPYHDSVIYNTVLPHASRLGAGQGQVVVDSSDKGFRVSATMTADEALQAASEEVAYGAHAAVFLVLECDGEPKLHICAAEDMVELLPEPFSTVPRERLSALT